MGVEARMRPHRAGGTFSGLSIRADIRLKIAVLACPPLNHRARVPPLLLTPAHFEGPF
jgi:hypothetical protein